MTLRIVPISLEQANDFIERLHRHNDPLPGHRWSIGVEQGEQLVGVALVGNPAAPALQKIPRVIEVRRVCTDGTQPSFAERIVRKREYVREHWPRKGASPEDVARAVAALVPTGNPFLDLCIWKGRFPSRRAQFCTQELKTIPLVEHQMGFIERGEAAAVWSWQGGLWNFRPILRWTAADAFEAGRIYRLDPNPLYRQNMTRVGCMPCINASKDEVLEISKRFPGHIDRIAYWERCVALASRRQMASFFPDPDRDVHLNKRGIRNVVEWSKTQRGGRLVDFIRLEEPKACESAYGLCE